MKSKSNIEGRSAPELEEVQTPEAKPVEVKVNMQIANEDLEFTVLPVSFGTIEPCDQPHYDQCICGINVTCKHHALVLLLCCEDAVLAAEDAFVHGLVRSISVSDPECMVACSMGSGSDIPIDLQVLGIQLVTAPGAWPDDKPPVRYTQMLRLPENQAPLSRVEWTNSGRTIIETNSVIINCGSDEPRVLRKDEVLNVAQINDRVCINRDRGRWYTFLCTDEDTARQLASDLKDWRVHCLEINDQIRMIVCRDDSDNVKKLRVLGAENLRSKEVAGL